MALFKQIKADADLPPEGSSYERQHQDFKKIVDGNRPYELAKDVAAFANATGGVILVGVEDERDRLARYAPLTQEQADDTRRHIQNGVKDRCFPNPPCDVEVIPRGGGFVVAVNIWPLPDQLVGVRAPTEKEPGEKKAPKDAYVFPVRKQTGTDYLEPQELAPLMLPQLRLRAIQLESVPARERQNLRVCWRHRSEASLGATLLDVDIRTAEVRFLVTLGGGDFNPANSTPIPLTLSLDTIDTVQRLERKPLEGLAAWLPPSTGRRFRVVRARTVDRCSTFEDRQPRDVARCNCASSACWPPPDAIAPKRMLEVRTSTHRIRPCAMRDAVEGTATTVTPWSWSWDLAALADPRACLWPVNEPLPNGRLRPSTQSPAGRSEACTWGKRRQPETAAYLRLRVEPRAG